MSKKFSLDELKSQPLMGIWSVEGHDHELPGFLYLDESSLSLKLHFSIDGAVPFDQAEVTHPLLQLFAPPRQPTLQGRTRAAGCVTLFNCAQLWFQAAHQVDGSSSRIELTLRPTQAWVGDIFVATDEAYETLTFDALGLHNVLSTIRIESKRLEGELKDATDRELKRLTGAQQALLVHRREEPRATVTKNGKSFKIGLCSFFSQEHSSTLGVTARTSDQIMIEAEDAQLSDLIDVSFELEQFLALLCIGPFRRDRITIRTGDYRRAELLWRLGQPIDETKFSIMPHQLLVALGRRPDLTSTAIERWFAANDAIRMARWLIFEALGNEISSSSKFLSVAQAWEVSGRERSTAAPFDKPTFRNMCKEVREVIQGTLGTEPAERLMNLLQSSNREGFGAFVENTLKTMPPMALDAICGDVPNFVTMVVQVRNTLTHLQERPKLSIEKASYLSLFLTYKLIVLFCIDTCVSVGLPLDNLPGMLGNNSMAQTAMRPLPESGVSPGGR